MKTRQPLTKLLCSVALLMAMSLYGAAQNPAPTDASGWEKLGTDDLQAGKYAEAIPALQKALDSGYPAQIGKYNLACAYARNGDKQKALDLLEAVAAGPGLPGPIANDPDLARLVAEPRFQKLVATAKR